MAMNDSVYTQTERDEWPHLIGIKKDLYSLNSSNTDISHAFINFPGNCTRRNERAENYGCRKLNT